MLFRGNSIWDCPLPSHTYAPGKIKTPFDVVWGTSASINEEHVRISPNTGDHLIDRFIRPDFDNIQRPQVRQGETLSQRISGPLALTARQTVSLGGNGGSYTIENGADMKISAGNSIILLPGFSAKAGAKVNIEVQSIDYGTVLKSSPISRQVVDYTIPSAYLGKMHNYALVENLPFHLEDKSVDAVDDSTFGINIYPNPFNGKVMVEISGSIGDEVLIELYNVVGNRVFTRRASSQDSIILDLAHLEPGMYVVRIVSGGYGATRHKLIKQ